MLYVYVYEVVYLHVNSSDVSLGVKTSEYEPCDTGVTMSLVELLLSVVLAGLVALGFLSVLLIFAIGSIHKPEKHD